LKLENNHIEQRSNFSDQQEQLFGNFDFNKLTIVIKRSIPWVILIIMATNLVAYLFVRNIDKLLFDYIYFPYYYGTDDVVRSCIEIDVVHIHFLSVGTKSDIIGQRK